MGFLEIYSLLYNKKKRHMYGNILSVVPGHTASLLYQISRMVYIFLPVFCKLKNVTVVEVYCSTSQHIAFSVAMPFL
jgi:hypothetical protein